MLFYSDHNLFITDNLDRNENIVIEWVKENVTRDEDNIGNEDSTQENDKENTEECNAVVLCL